MSPRIGAYARISLDVEGDALGVARQHADVQRLAQHKGWLIDDTYTDNNISAYQRGVIRPQFERLLTELDSGAKDGLAAYDLDRLARRPSDLERIIDVYERHPGLLFATVQGQIDLSTSNGRAMARVLVTMANKQSDDTSRRVKRKIQEQAENGQQHWAHAPYGYHLNGTLQPIEAAVVRSMGEMFLEGYSYREIAYRLNESGKRTRAGSPWFAGTIRQFMRSERFAAIRLYDGQEYAGKWNAIFTLDEWDAIKQKVQARREPFSAKPVAKRYLLTGVLVCGACGGYLYGMTKRDPSKKGQPQRQLRPTYQCRVRGETQRREGCGGVIVGAAPLDHLIREAVIYRLDTPDLAALLGSEGDASKIRELLAESKQLEGRKNALVDDYADGTLSKFAYVRARDRVEAKLSHLNGAIDQLRRARFNLSLSAGETVRGAWMSRPDGWRRELMDTIIEKIVVSPSAKKPYYDVDGQRMRFDPERVTIKWKV